MRWILISAFVLLVMGCGKVVPPGKIVIILKPNGESSIVTRGVYRKLGRDRVYFVDQKLKSFHEPLQVLCADDINMSVDVKAVLSFNVSESSMEFIKQKVPAVKVGGGEELSLEQFYKMAVRDVIRGSSRNIISPMITDEIRPKRQQLEADIHNLVTARVKELKYPLSVSAMLISNIDYPETVIAMRNRIKEAKLRDQEKAAEAEAMLAEAQRQVAIEQEKAKSRMVRAQAQADENKILTQSLTPQFLMWRQLEVLEGTATKLAAGQSNTVFMLPYATMDRDLMNTAMIRDAVAKR